MKHAIGYVFLLASGFIILTRQLPGKPVLVQEFAQKYQMRFIDVSFDSTLRFKGLAFNGADCSSLITATVDSNQLTTIYRFHVVRDRLGHIMRCDGAPTFVASGNNGSDELEGQFAIGPGNVLFAALTGFSIMQIKPGESNATKRIDFLPPVDETSGLNFVPKGFAGADRLKVFSWKSSRWQDATIASDGFSTYDISFSTNSVQLSGGLLGAAFVPPSSPLFTNASVLVTFGNPASWGGVDSYALDSNGDPIPASRRSFITNFWSASGAAMDPLTGDFLFCSLDGDMTNRLIAISGFNPLHQISGAISNAQFQGSYRGLWGTNYIVEATSNLSAQALWKPIQTNTATFNPVSFVDAVTNNSPRRFYRLRSLP